MEQIGLRPFFDACVNVFLVYFENESISSNVLSTVLLIVRSFVRVLTLYCWDKSCQHYANKYNFCIDSVSIILTHVLQEILFYLFRQFRHNFAKIKVLLLSYFRKNFWTISLDFLEYIKCRTANLAFFSFQYTQTLLKSY